MNYLPHSEPGAYYSKPEDTRLAEAFKLVGDLIEASKNKDEFQLFVSTCRNAYMTMNALFVDVREAMGHGRMPASLNQIVYALGHEQQPFATIQRHLERVNLALVQFDAKLVCWQNRQVHFAFLKEYLSGLPHSSGQRLQEMLFDDLERERQGSGNGWPLEFVTISTDKHPHLTKYWKAIQAARNIIYASYRVARAILPVTQFYHLAKDTGDLPHEPHLFDTVNWPLANEVWKEHLQCWDQWTPFLQTSMDALAPICDPPINDLPAAPMIDVQEGAPKVESFSAIIKVFCDYLINCVDTTHLMLTRVFRPNIGEAPMPEVYKIDLRENDSTKARLTSDTMALTEIKCEDSRPAALVVAIPQFAPPSRFLDGTSYRYLKDEYRELIFSLAKKAIEQAAANKAQLIVFPELFFPEDKVAALLSLSDSHNIAIIGGQEGDWTSDRRYQNSCSIRFPHQIHEHKQYKHRPSSLEPENLKSRGGRVVFVDSMLGTFAVILCSDYQYLDSVWVASSVKRPLDFIVVCSMNDHPDMWEAMAFADANRLMCHVVIANNYPDANNEWSSKGSGVIGTGRSLETARLVPMTGQNTACAIHEGVDFTISLFELKFTDIVRSRRRPATGRTTPPLSRLDL